MAYLRRLPRSPYWIAGFSLPDGRRTQRSTKEKDRKKAMKLAVQWEEAARRRLTESQARKVISDIHEQIHGTRLVTPSVNDYVARWLDRKKGETAPVTFLAYRHAVQGFRDFLGDKAAQPIHYVTAAQVSEWRDAVAKQSTPRTANNKVKVVRTFFQTAWRDGLLMENPAAKVPTLKVTKGKRRPFSLPELKALLRVASVEWKGLILFGLYTGQRLKDIASLTWSNVDVEHDEIRIVTSKTGRRQVLPIAKPVRAYLTELPAGDDPKAPLFPDAYKVATVNRDVSALSQRFHELLVSANLAQPRTAKERGQGQTGKVGTGKGRSSARENSGLSFHSLRHSAVTLLKLAGVSAAVAQDLIGHQSAAISASYTHVDDEAKRAALSKLPDVLGE